jgi:glycosyltransferase involved in cell wall biosynthesis
LIVGELNLESLTIATPFYNEEQGLDNYFNTIQKIHKLVGKKVNLKFLFIDDGSTDKTKDELFKFKKDNQIFEIEILCHEKNFGYGRTLKNSISMSQTKYLITYDSDCTYDYKIIEKLLDKARNEKHDIINVSYKLAEKDMEVSYLRKILSFGSSFMYKNLFSTIKNYNITVLTCSFRIYDLKKISEIKLISDDFNCCAELLIKSMLKNLKITEIAGENIGRKFGYSKMKIMKNIYNTLKTIFLIKMN